MATGNIPITVKWFTRKDQLTNVYNSPWTGNNETQQAGFSCINLLRTSAQMIKMQIAAESLWRGFRGWKEQSESDRLKEER